MDHAFSLLYRKLLSCKVKKRSAGMRTAAYKVDVAEAVKNLVSLESESF